MQELGRMLVLLGILVAMAGLVVLGVARTGFPIGRLPGDLAYRGKHFSIFAPLGTSLLLSVVLTLVLYVLSRFRR
jgi:hypothetical protein